MQRARAASLVHIHFSGARGIAANRAHPRTWELKLARTAVLRSVPRAYPLLGRIAVFASACIFTSRAHNTSRARWYARASKSFGQDDFNWADRLPITCYMRIRIRSRSSPTTQAPKARLDRLPAICNNLPEPGTMGQFDPSATFRNSLANKVAG